MAFNRIISLVPSLTELVIDIGVEERLIGRTRFCIHPQDKVENIEIVGGTKNPNIEKIIGLNPDLIIANHEENRKKDIEELQKHTKVLVTKIDTIEDALQEISTIGTMLSLSKNTEELIVEIEHTLSLNDKLTPVSTAYFIWKNPWMVVASNTYINDVMESYGLQNVYENSERYPDITLEDLIEKSPELVLLSSEPYPFKETHVQELKGLLPSSEVQLINGEWFSWYGSGMVKAFGELNKWRKTIEC